MRAFSLSEIKLLKRLNQIKTQILIDWFTLIYKYLNLKSSLFGGEKLFDFTASLFSQRMRAVIGDKVKIQNSKDDIWELSAL